MTPTEKTEVKEEKKHKRIITSRGMVRLKGDGEERPRRPRPDGEKNVVQDLKVKIRMQPLRKLKNRNS